MPTVTFVKDKKKVKTIECEDGANLRKVALRAGVEVYSGVDKVLHCPGLGMCTTCKVHIKKGTENVSKQGFWEKMNMLKCIIPPFPPFAFFGRIGHEDELRLSCQTKVHGDCEVEATPKFNWHGERYWG